MIASLADAKHMNLSKILTHTPPLAPTASGIPCPPQGKEVRAAALRTGEEGVALPVTASLSPLHLLLAMVRSF